jgi:hypothetical protein
VTMNFIVDLFDKFWLRDTREHSPRIVVLSGDENIFDGLRQFPKQDFIQNCTIILYGPRNCPKE